MSSTRLVIIIPGSQAKLPAGFKKIFSGLYRHFGVEYGHEDWAYDLKKHIESKAKIDIVVLDWSRGITRTFSLNPAIKKLTVLLKEIHYRYDEIILFGKSLGGVIAEEAVRQFTERKFHLVYVATPHRRKELRMSQALSVTNIYSSSDKFQQLGINVLYFCSGSRTLRYAENIALDNIGHSDFKRNITISYQGHEIPLFDFYTDIILTRKKSA
jgi:hypothetical protein